MDFTYIFVALLGAWITYVAWLVVYRLFFHPYANYPGPFLARVSYFYAGYHAWISDTPVAQFRCHQKYGHVVRYNPDSLMFDQPSAVREIYAIGKNFNRGKAYHPMNNDPTGPKNLLFQRDNKEHSRRRRIITQAFSDRSLRQSQYIAKPHIDTLCDLVSGLTKAGDGKQSEPTNIHPWLYWATQDIMTDVIFGRSYNMLTDLDERKAGDFILKSLGRAHLVYQYPWLFKQGLNKWFDFGTWFMPDTSKDIMKYLGRGAMSTMERIQSPPENADQRRDVLSYLISAKDPNTGTGLANEDIVAEACLLLLAGASTLSESVSCFFWYLTRASNKHVYQKLAQELRSTFATAADINFEKLERCVYLSAAVAEGLRFTSGIAFWRDAQAGGATITIPHLEADEAIPSTTTSTQSYHIPAGCSVGHCNYAQARNPNIYPDADTFDPDRWITTSQFYSSRGLDAASAQKLHELAKTASVTFSMGQRSCVAERLARALYLQIVGNLVWHFDMVQAEGAIGETGGGGPGKGLGRENKESFQWYGSFTFSGNGPVVMIEHVQ